MTIHEADFLQLSYFSFIIAFPYTYVVGNLNGAYLYSGNKSVDKALNITTQV